MFRSAASSAVLVVLALASSAVAQYVNCPAPAGDFVVLKDVPANAATVNSGGAYGNSTADDHTDIAFTAQGAEVTTLGHFNGAQPYWYFKFDKAECFDMSGYNKVFFDFKAPVDSSFAMTFTVHSANCSTVTTCAGRSDCTRQPDSTYLNITKYVIPNGTWQNVTIPLEDFLPNTDGTGLTDFYHIKDWTFIGFTPETSGTKFIFNDFILKAGCTKGIATPPADRPGVSTRPAGQDPKFNETSTTTTALAADSTLTTTGSSSKTIVKLATTAVITTTAATTKSSSAMTFKYFFSSTSSSLFSFATALIVCFLMVLLA